MLGFITAILLSVIDFVSVETIVVGDTAVTDTILVVLPERPRLDKRLTDTDVREVADHLGVEPAVIRAVIDIEAGRAHQGFWADGKPIINFEFGSFKKRTAKRGITLSQAKHPVLFAPTNSKKYGGQQAAVQARLDDAMSIDSVAAIESTFWGMFQIGGFNWRRCGTSSPQDFVRQMSQSERAQLDIFVKFMEADPKLVDALRRRDWARFARSYNGPSYARRGYHTRLAAAYNRWK